MGLGGIVILGALCMRVGYRFRDGFMILIPLYVLPFATKILYRIASPEPYWEHGPPAGTTKPRLVVEIAAFLVLLVVGLWVTGSAIEFLRTLARR